MFSHSHSSRNGSEKIGRKFSFQWPGEKDAQIFLTAETFRSIKEPSCSTLSPAWTDQFLGYKAISIPFPKIWTESAACKIHLCGRTQPFSSCLWLLPMCCLTNPCSYKGGGLFVPKGVQRWKMGTNHNLVPNSSFQQTGHRAKSTGIEQASSEGGEQNREDKVYLTQIQSGSFLGPADFTDWTESRQRAPRKIERGTLIGVKTSQNPH